LSCDAHQTLRQPGTALAAHNPVIGHTAEEAKTALPSFENIGAHNPVIGHTAEEGCLYLSTVTPDHSSVRNGDAGNPS